MINKTKRPADKNITGDEPAKKKPFKTFDKTNKKFEKKSFKKPTFNNDKKDGKNVENNPESNKYVNKFAGKSNFKETNSNNATAKEKTDWRKFKQERKELKLKRKQTKDSYDISIEAKQIYEKLKCRRTQKKSDLVQKLYNLISGGDTIKKLIMAHDTARIIQCMLKFATPALREKLSEILLPLSVDMSLSKYSHFCVLRMFKYGSPNIKSKLVDSFYGNVVRLATHNISSKILDHIYLTVANAKQKIYLRQEFYSDLYKNSKDDNVKKLSDTYKDATNMKTSILSAVKINLEHVANKQLLDSSLVHAIILEYINEIEDDKLEETLTTFGTHIPLLLTTKEGTQASITCFYKSTAKNRRAIIKAIKEHLIKICIHEHGHIFILTVLNSLDDTKATKKAIYDTIHPELETLMSNQYGRRVIAWFTSPADTNSFHPTLIATIEEGLAYGKKDKEIRRKEILEQVEEPIALAIAEKPNFWLSNRHICLSTADILKNLSEVNFNKASAALASVIVNPIWQIDVEDDDANEKKTKKSQDIEKIIADATKLKKQKLKNDIEEESSNDDDDDDDDDDDVSETKKVEKKKKNTEKIAGIEEAGLHIVLKKVIKNDKERLAKNENAQTFGSILVENLSHETLERWLTVNRACFILLNIVENNNAETIEQLKGLIQPLKELLTKQNASGAKLLLKKLNL